jgi:hypothetical protein
MVNTALIIPRADIFPEKMSNNGPIQQGALYSLFYLSLGYTTKDL